MSKFIHNLLNLNTWEERPIIYMVCVENLGRYSDTIDVFTLFSRKSHVFYQQIHDASDPLLKLASYRTTRRVQRQRSGEILRYKRWRKRICMTIVG